MSNRKFRRMVNRMSDKAKLAAVRKAASIITAHPERYSEEQIARAQQLLEEAESQVASSDTPG